MAIQLSKEAGHVQYGTYNLVADEAAEISSLPTNIAPGSTCFVIETSKTYILNTQGVWHEYLGESGGGGGGSTVTMADNPDGGVDLSVDDDTKTLAKQESVTELDTEIEGHEDRIAALEEKEFDFQEAVNNIVIETLQTEAKTIVGAINEVSGASIPFAEEIKF